MLARVRRWWSAGEASDTMARLDGLERRMNQLETLLEALQDAVHRDAVRRDQEEARLDRKTEPEELARSLSRDARRRGL